MARRIVFIRHGKPQIEEGIPSARWRLSDDGRKSVTALADRFRDFTFRVVASSPEPKAIGTAEALAAPLGLAVEVDAGFAEHARRSVGFLSRDDLESRISRLFDRRDELVFGDETANQAYARFCTALERQTAKRASNIMIVTHGTILTIYLSHVAAIDPLPFWRALATPAAVILEAGKIHIVELGAI
jgi:broad specificity phosphatase PhoE